ncbi:MAG: protein MraZ [Parcubacteria group bacterium Gr01-1014_66]|nr:MAG: protein MraZ [Parcubacteria group bacterium Gr01-1014_66]
MLIGEYIHTLDAKKRVALPARLRKELGERIILTRGLNSCLCVYSLKQWESLTEKLGKLPTGQSDTRSFLRLLFSGAMEIELDQLGRMLIPDYLKQYAGLSQRIVTVGAYDRLEIWDEERWSRYKQEVEKNTDMIAEKLGELGLY